MPREDLLDGVEEIGPEVSTKKVVKKKIIKKIVKRRNADGSELPPEVFSTTTLIQEGTTEVTHVENLQQ